MKGYLYLDNDHNLNIRLKDFIEIEDPLFWDRNQAYIDIVWEFDSQDPEKMEKILKSLKTKELPTRAVQDACKSMGFDLDVFLKERKEGI